MKKQKKPIVLVTVLVIFLVFACAMNYTGSSKSGPEGGPPKSGDDGKTVSAPREADSKESVANSVKSGLTATKKAGPDDEPPAPQKPGGPPVDPRKAPLIQSPKMAAAGDVKPKPNESSTSTQWYPTDASH